MHLFLVFTVLFLPGIKSSYDGKQEFNSKGVDTANNLVATQNENQRELDKIGFLKLAEKGKSHHKGHYVGHHEEDRVFKKWRKEQSRRNHNGDMDKNHNRFQVSNERGNINEDYSSDKHPSGEKKSWMNDKTERELKLFDKNDRQQYHAKEFKKIKERKHQENYNKNHEKSKTFKKMVKKDMGLSERYPFPYESYQEKGNAKHKLVKEKSKVFEKLYRFKRQEDSPESDESHHGSEFHENSDVDMDKLEKEIIAHLMEGAIVRESAKNYNEAIEVNLREKDDEGQGLVPVVEEVITRSRGYVSCGENGLACEIRRNHNRNGQNQEDHVKRIDSSANNLQSGHETTKEDKQNVDDYDWLKNLEQEIIDSGIEVKFHHQ